MRADESELDALMARLADGDRRAFDPLFHALHPRAVRLARNRLGDGALADDAAQSTLLRVFARAGEFERGRAVLPWFYAIAANEIRALERHRGLERTRTVPLAPDTDATDATDPYDPDEALMSAELARALDAAIDTLDGPSADAIATLLGRTVARPAPSPAALRKRLSRAYARLRVLLGGAL